MAYLVLKKPSPVAPQPEPSTQSQVAAAPSPSDTAAASPNLGEIVIRGDLDESISSQSVPVCDGAWVAVPLWAVFGGTHIVYRDPSSNEVEVKNGYWMEGNPVILWKLEKKQEPVALELVPWKQHVALEWRSLASQESTLDIGIASPQEKGSFLSFVPPPEARNPGILMQAGKVVGWTFGHGTEKGYVWRGPLPSNLSTNIQMDAQFASNFSNYREARLRQVMAPGKGTSAEGRLEALAGAFRLVSALPSEDLPTPLKPEAVFMQMHALASQLIQAGRARDVVRVLNNQVLAEAQDPGLVIDAVRAILVNQEYSDGLQFLERARAELLKKQGQQSPALDQYQAKLYKDWLKDILKKGSYHSAMAVFEEARRYFPHDVELHLLGVEAALAENGWQKAQELFGQQAYPDPWKDRAAQLEGRIRELEDQDVILIPLTLEEGQMCVNVLLNGSYIQRCIVDTGASQSTIPWSAADALKIEVDDSTAVKGLVTASGIVVTNEVRLRSVDLKSVRQENFKVILLDLPLLPDCGLLGMDFFEKYRVEVDKENRIMRLKKR